MTPDAGRQTLDATTEQASGVGRPASSAVSESKCYE